MTLKLVSLLVILIIYGQATEQFILNFMDIEHILEWITVVIRLRNAIDDISGFPRHNVLLLMKRFDEISSEISALDTHMDIRLSEILKTLLDNHQITVDLALEKRKLCDCINIVNRLYDDSLKYTFDTKYHNDTLEMFRNSVLTGSRSISNTLRDIESLIVPSFGNQIVPGFLSLTLQLELQNLPTDCSKYVSAQQRMYYIYVQIIIAEVKGFITLERVYTSMWLMNKSQNKYDNEVKDAKDNFKSRVKKYFKMFVQSMNKLPRHLRQCDVNPPIRDVNFIEVQNFSRAIIFNKYFRKDTQCWLCMGESELVYYGISHMNTTIFNCKKSHNTLTTCPAQPGSHREYLWWKSDEDIYYGHSTACDEPKVVDGGVEIFMDDLYMSHAIECPLCICSMDLKMIQKDNSPAIWAISVTEQIFDIRNNMVLTGIKFVSYNNAIHLQIQQTNFSQDALIHNESSWKELDTLYQDNSTTKNVKFHYEPLRHDLKSIYLDDIIVPANTVVTGVKFIVVNNSAFMLQVYGTPFDYATGKLNISGSAWFNALNYPLNPKDYERKRIEININESDDPIRSSQFKYDRESNKFIKFIHTDVRKDAGQTTIPLLDSQAVETKPSFPLGGIGLSFRGRDGYGGYISPRIYTLDITQCINIEMINQMGDAPKICGKRRSIVRRIGSFLPLKPHPKIYVSVTPLHSMTSSMINEETSNNDLAHVNGFGISDRLSSSKPDLLEPISFGSEVRLLALEQELQELRTQVSLIVKTASQRQHYASMASLSNGNTQEILPPPPPPLPPPTTPHIARRASLQDHKLEDKKKPLTTQKSMGDMLKDIDKVKLKPIERSPGGRPVRPKRENSPCNDLQEILRKRYVAMRSPDSRNSSTFNIDESFSA
ncbi:hypothetical protein PV326_014330 [Microctonus aethiopoides]|nr:hypothetical protein PV326_014330 [Microctonus aethiopoides]